MRVSSSPRDPSNTGATNWRPGGFEGVVGLSYNGSDFFLGSFCSLFSWDVPPAGPGRAGAV